MAIVKVAVLGDTECGKTSFTQRYTTGNFPDPNMLRTTIGASFDTKKVELSNGTECTLSIWDFGGQKRFIDQMKTMIRGAKIGLLFFDVSKMQTFDNLFSYWIPAINENSNLDFSHGDGKRFILVGNKIDLIDGEKIDMIGDEMNEVAAEYGMSTHLISAKTGVGMDTLDSTFLSLVEKYGA